MDLIRHDRDGQMLLGFAVVQGFGRKPKADPLPPHQAKQPHVASECRAVSTTTGRTPPESWHTSGHRGEGATRDELSIALDLPIQSVCGPIRKLLDAATSSKQRGPD